MPLVLAAVLLAQIQTGLLWSPAVKDGTSVIAISRLANGNLTINIPDRYVYQRYNYATGVYGGGTMRVAVYHVYPQMKATSAASGPGLRDTRPLFAPMRMEFSTVASNGDQVEVYATAEHFRVVIYRKVQ